MQIVGNLLQVATSGTNTSMVGESCLTRWLACQQAVAHQWQQTVAKGLVATALLLFQCCASFSCHHHALSDETALTSSHALSRPNLISPLPLAYRWVTLAGLSIIASSSTIGHCSIVTAFHLDHSLWGLIHHHERHSQPVLQWQTLVCSWRLWHDMCILFVSYYYSLFFIFTNIMLLFIM